MGGNKEKDAEDVAAVLVVSQAFPVTPVLSRLCRASYGCDGPVICDSPCCDPGSAPCKSSRREGASACGSVAATLQRLGWTQDAPSVRVTIATGSGTVSFQLDTRSALVQRATEPAGTPPELTAAAREHCGTSGPRQHLPAIRASNVSANGGTDSGRLRVWVASSQSDLLRRLQQELTEEGDLDVLVDELSNGASLCTSVRQQRPDVVMLDKRLFDALDGGSQLEIREYAARYPVLLLLDDVGEDTVEEILRNRFQGYLLNHCPADQCARAIRAVNAGEIWLPRSLLIKALEQWLGRKDAAPSSPPPEEASLHSFTDREKQVLALLKHGLSNKQIARELGVMEDTVKKHLQHVYDKLGVRRRTLVLVSAARA